MKKQPSKCNILMLFFPRNKRNKPTKINKQQGRIKKTRKEQSKKITRYKRERERERKRE